MSSVASTQALDGLNSPFNQKYVEQEIEDLITSLPDPRRLSKHERRAIIARYAAALEGNFIYWMTGAYLAARSEDARSIILENLLEEVRDSHPAMLRRFVLAANAVPTGGDAMAIHQEITGVRLFVGRLSPAPILLMMAFFEGFIQRFMGFLEELAQLQGSTEREYTEVHGVCDIAHTQGLLRALAAELEPAETDANLFEGVELLRTLIRQIIAP